LRGKKIPNLQKPRSAEDRLEEDISEDEDDDITEVLAEVS